jgi:7-cyano-7-deazaguanine reductase
MTPPSPGTPQPADQFALLEAFPTPADHPFVIEHVSEEFTSLCPVTGHPDFGSVTVRFVPRPPGAVGTCVELKSLKVYLQAFRNQGIYYEAVTNRIRDDLVRLMNPVWLLVKTDWRGRGGIRSIIRATQGDVPSNWLH